MSLPDSLTAASNRTPAGPLSCERSTFNEDLELARACSRHPRDESAWKSLTQLHSARLVAQAAAMGCSHPEDEVHDLLVDLWLPGRKGHNLLSTYAGRAPLGPWLNLVLRRRIAATRLTRVRRATLLQDSGIAILATPSAQDVAAEREARALMDELVSVAMAALSPRDRELIEARYVKLEMGSCTASRMGVSPSYVSKRCRQVLELMKLRLSPMIRRGDPDALEVQ